MRFHRLTTLLLAPLLWLASVHTSAAQSPVGKVIVYNESTTETVTSVKGVIRHQLDTTGHVVDGVLTVPFKLTRTNYHVYDLGNLKHTFVSYYSYRRYLINKFETVKEFRVSEILDDLPFFVIPLYSPPGSTPVKQWLNSNSGSYSLATQTGGAETEDTSDDTAIAGEDRSQFPVENQGYLDTWGFESNTLFLSGKATQKAIVRVDSTKRIATVIDNNKAVFPDVITFTGLATTDHLVSNAGEDSVRLFPGYTYTEHTSRPLTGKLTLDKTLTYKANDTDADGAGSIAVRTVENALEHIRNNLIANGYVQR